jgi:hypothetical protein
LEQPGSPLGGRKFSVIEVQRTPFGAFVLKCDVPRPLSKALEQHALFAVTQVTRNTPVPGHDAGVEQGTSEPGGPAMYIDIIWKTALPALIGLFAISTVVMNSSAVGRGVARSAAVDLVDCNIRDPFSPCFDTKIGYPAGDLFIAGESF